MFRQLLISVRRTYYRIISYSSHKQIFKYKQIVSGWYFFITDNGVSKKKAQEKAKKCSTCKHAKPDGRTMLRLIREPIKVIQNYKCNKCNCPLSAMLRSDKHCPIYQF